MRLAGVIFCLILLQGSALTAQQSDIQQLKRLVNAAKDQTIKIQIADSIFQANQFSNLDVAEYFAGQINQLAKATGNESDKISQYSSSQLYRFRERRSRQEQTLVSNKGSSVLTLYSSRKG